MGDSLEEMLRGLEAAGLLRQVLVSSCRRTALPRERLRSLGWLGRAGKRLGLYDRSGRIDYLSARLFDRWVSAVMPPAEIFESWTFCCLSSLRVARRRGSQTILGLGSAHPRTYQTLINTERQKWGWPPEPDRPWMRQVERELALADRIVVQSRFSERTLMEHGLAAEKITRLPLGVDVARFRPPEARTPGPFRVLFLGQVTLRKGLQHLLAAWQQLGWRDAELLVAGKVLPDGQRVLDRYAGLPGLRVAGYLPDQVAVLQQCDVFVAPSLEDGFGLVVTEAMACARPVIVSGNMGAADLVQDDENGRVVPAGDVAGYAAALEAVRADPEQARQMGWAGRATAQAQTWEAYRARLVALHTSI